MMEDELDVQNELTWTCAYLCPSMPWKMVNTGYFVINRTPPSFKQEGNANPLSLSPT